MQHSHQYGTVRLEKDEGGGKIVMISFAYTPLYSAMAPASFPDPAQLFVTFSTEKQERAWYLFSRE